jgi:peptidoglycan/LPS O-acetylase OafA/YrhL
MVHTCDHVRLMSSNRVSLPRVRALDGIRGVALIAILLYHSGHLVGGFLSVDMFFALSGFLITSLLLVEWDRTGTVALGAFWARRARRLLPALGFLLVGIAVYALVWAQPSELTRIRDDVIATVGYAANWHAIYAHESYFAAFTPSPLRHAWTLAVEEQFYLLWPMVMALVVTRFRRHTAKAVLGIAVVGGLASAALMALLYSPADPNRAYYGTDTRAYAVFAGIAAAAAVHVWGHPTRRGPRRILEGLAFVSVAGIAVLWNRFEATSAFMYRGGFLLGAIALTALLLSAANPVRGPLNRMLSFRAFVWLGTISYGVYLWHWPIDLVVDQNRTGLAPWPLFAVRTALAIAFGTFSYFAIELPVRRGFGTSRQWRLASPALVAGLVALVVLATAGAAASPLDGADAALAGNTRAKMLERRAQVDAGIPASTPRVVLAGDSTAVTLGLGAPNRSDSPVAVHSAAMLGCGLAPGVPIGLAHFTSESVCGQWPAVWHRALEIFRPRALVLLVGAWEIQDRLVAGRTYPSGSPALGRLLRHQLGRAEATASAAGVPLVVLLQPCFGPPDGGREFKHLDDPTAIRWFDRIETEFAAAHPDTVRTVDLNPIVCPGGRALDRLDGATLRDDGVHFTSEGATAVWRRLGPQLQATLRG